MKANVFVVACFFVLAFPARVAAEPWTDSGLRGQFLRVGPTAFSCMIKKEHLTPGFEEKFTSEQPCVFFGTPDEPLIAIGQPAKPFMERLGTPAQVDPDTGGSTNYLFLIVPGDDPTFIGVTVAGEVIAALQVTGPRGAPQTDAFAFNAIKVGSSADEVRARFGSAFLVQRAGTATTEFWSFLPYPFSFVLTDNRVTSIRISNADLK